MASRSSSVSVLAARLAWLMPGALLFASTPAAAYVGPGVGLSAIGSIVAVAVAVIIALLGLVLFPIRLLMKTMRRNRMAADATIAERRADAS